MSGRWCWLCLGCGCMLGIAVRKGMRHLRCTVHAMLWLTFAVSASVCHCSLLVHVHVRALGLMPQAAVLPCTRTRGCSTV